MSGIRDAKRKRDRRRKQRKLTLMLGALFTVILCVAVVIGVKSMITKNTPDSGKKAAEKEAKKNDKPDTSKVEIKNIVINTKRDKNDTDKSTTITVSSVGDCTLGTDVNFNPDTSLNAYYNARGADYFFQNVRPILEADDLTIVNMEGTLTTQEQREDKTYAFKGPPEYAAILTGGSVEAANLANNHSRDYGEKSYTDTIAALEDAGIATFGYERADVVDIKGVKVGLTGIYELAEHMEKKQQVKENIAALKEAGAQLIIVNFHWGIEREYVPNDTQKALARLAVDEGADLVIGHHPHVLQGVEKYKGKYIAYSLGNFCFGGNSNPEDKDTMIFQQTFTITKDGVKKDENINMIPCSLSSANGYNDYSPVPLEGSEKERVLNKIEENSQAID
ncbi:CapA family protein [Extibacter muris]|uniref:CapA family protein n=1 Tax=Extibacter muris TaxID=1796622 RepID=UPI001D06B570|nr:CapA family protein [Extibacter muris]MCB6200904.1 CapA family protein [Extibacter muris]MCQ4662234.1 CapA family protein [Extibacter muris]MCQ4691852.1 CapA family protein [Extibacter muris]